MIKIEHLTKSFNGQRVLNDLNLSIQQGEIIVILGPSGVGKSVFLQHLIGLLKPDRGDVWIDSVDITKLSEKKLLKIRKNMGYLFQQSALYDFLDVYDNIAFPLREHSSLNEHDIAEKINRILKLVDLEGVENKYPAELSGGMRKRVALARAMILDSKILLCDEPTSGLDPIRSRDISDLIKKVSDEFACTTVVTSHDIPNSFRVANRVAILQEGKIAAMGTKKELFNSQDPFLKEFLMNF